LSVEKASAVVTSVEQLLENAGNVRAIRLVAATRQRLANQLVGWSGAAFKSRGVEIDRQMQAADWSGALANARTLHSQATMAGPEAYEGAAYDVGLSSLLLGRVLHAAGRADEALAAATEAENVFRELADTGITDAVLMAAASLTLRADALVSLGSLDEAATAYEKAIEEAEALGAVRDAAVNRGQLGTVRIYQGRYADAIATYELVRRTFEMLGEPLSVAGTWHQLGMVHLRAKQLDAAERAYLRALSISTRLEDRSRQASTLGELGNLYAAARRPEESVDHHRRAADLYAALGDQRMEGFARGNLAVGLRSLQKYAPARVEVERAIELTRGFGHAGEQWKAWSILSDIEKDLGNTDAAAIARRRAIDAYAAYRRDGGYPQRRTGQLIAHLATAIANGVSPRQLTSQITPPPGAPADAASFICLQAILSGGHDPASLADPALHFSDVVELTLLLETLSSAERPRQA
jgi:tetratricopeptide (TPR) repeat protein